MAAIKRMVNFEAEAERARDGVCVAYDLVGFSQFFNQPDIHSYIPAYLNHIIQSIETCLFGGDGFWKAEAERIVPPLSLQPAHRSFMGDGGLYVWAPDESRQITPDFVTTLMSRLCDLRNSFRKITKDCEEFIPVADLPRAIRFAVTRGSVFELASTGASEKEYIGVGINLATRLLKYCAGLDFVGASRLNPPKATLETLGLRKVVAVKLTDFSREIVLVSKTEFAALDPAIRQNLFEELQD